MFIKHSKPIMRLLVKTNLLVSKYPKLCVGCNLTRWSNNQVNILGRNVLIPWIWSSRVSLQCLGCGCSACDILEGVIRGLLTARQITLFGLGRTPVQVFYDLQPWLGRLADRRPGALCYERNKANVTYGKLGLSSHPIAHERGSEDTHESEQNTTTRGLRGSRITNVVAIMCLSTQWSVLG